MTTIITISLIILLIILLRKPNQDYFSEEIFNKSKYYFSEEGKKVLDKKYIEGKTTYEIMQETELDYDDVMFVLDRFTMVYDFLR